jgi:hypothetical protein
MTVQIVAAPKMTSTKVEWPNTIPLREGYIVIWQEAGLSYRGLVHYVELDFRPGAPPPTLFIQEAKPIRR